jgi:hypothetical protein
MPVQLIQTNWNQVMDKPKNQIEKCEELTTQKPKHITNAKSTDLKKIVKLFHDCNKFNMKHKMCTMHIAHIITLIET